MCTPVAPVPGFGLARSTASLATSFDVPPPIDTESVVSRGDGVANSLRGHGERLVVVQPFGAAEIHVPLVDARAFDDRRVALEHRANLPALLAAGAARHRNAHRVRAEAQRARDRHRRAHTELSRLVRRRADDAATLARAADDEQRLLPGPVGVDHPRHGDEERVGVGEENPSRGHRTCRSWTKRDASRCSE